MPGNGDYLNKMKKKLPLVSIVVVNYNGRKFLKDCFDFIFNIAYPKNKLEVIMVDNCSTDDSVGFAQKNYKKLIVLKNDSNNYARANNLGIRKAKGKYIAFINNDVRITKDWLFSLIKILEKEKYVGAAGGKILFQKGIIQSTGHEEYPDFYWGDRGFKHKDKGQFNNIEEVFSLCGAAILFRKACLEDVGMFDEDFVMYLEDVDICIRCANKKWKILYVPRSIAYHSFKGTSSQELVTFFSERNRLLLLAKHFPGKLGDALYGKGYFIPKYENNKQRTIYDILPEVFSKLMASTGKENINNIMQSIFNNLNKISRLEYNLIFNELESKELLLRAKGDELEGLIRADAALNAQILNLSQDLKTKEELLSKNAAALEQERAVSSQLNNQLESLNQDLKTKEELLSKNAAALFQLEVKLQRITQELMQTSSDLKRLIRLDKKLNFLIIKPQRISLEDTATVIEAVKKKYPNSSICLFANLITQDYERLSENKNISKIYRPKNGRLSLISTISFIFVFWLKRFDIAIALSSYRQRREYAGFRNAERLSLLSGSKSWQIYYTD